MSEPRIARALLSVADKTGLAELALRLSRAGVELVSTGKTREALLQAGVAARPIEDLSGFPEILDGRVKTLHPAIHGAILARRDLAAHQEQLARHAIAPIDLVVVNFYPFEKTVAQPQVALEEAIEQIDIGGPTLVRAAAKNFAHVTVLSDPADYPGFMAEFDAGAGAVSAAGRFALARKAFARVAVYDAAIANFLSSRGPQSAAVLGESFSLSLSRVLSLRYGENPHQQAALYGDFLRLAEPLHGKELSFNNVLDINSAIHLMLDFSDRREAVVAILKHNTPCGVALGASLKEAWDKALATDPDSPFGGIVITNRPWDLELARAVDELFTEVLIGPDFAPAVFDFLRRKKNRRLVRLHPEAARRDELDLKRVLGGLLVQTPDLSLEEPRLGRVVTRRAPTEAEFEALGFGLRVCKHVKSNAVVFAAADRTIAVGAGGTSRIDPLHAACEKAKRVGLPVSGSVLASEAFFPFPDGPALAAQAGATAIVQPGGAVRDAEVIAEADARGLAMVFTGVRHFRH